MGLLDTVNEQKALAKKSKETYRQLKRYMNNLENELEIISECWPNDAGDKYYIIKQLNIAGSEIASICSGYKNYTTNMERVLDVLKEFAEFLGVVSTDGYSFKTKGISKSSKSKIKLDTSVLKACGNRIIKLGSNIEAVQLDYKSIAAKIDDQIYRMLSGKISSLTSLNKRLDTQANQITKAGKAMVKISEKYELAEKNIAKKAVDLVNGKHVTYGDGTSSGVPIPRKEGRCYQMPTMTTYSLIENPYTYPDKNGKTYETIKNFYLYTGNNYSQKNSKYKGTEMYNYGCGATSIAICKAIMSGAHKEPKNYYVNGVGAVMGSYGKVVSVKGPQKGLATAYTQVKKGVPLVVQLNGPEKDSKGHFTTQHFVAIVGVVEGADPNNLKPSDFLAVDPVGGKIKRLDQCYKSVGGTKGPVSITSVRYYK